MFGRRPSRRLIVVGVVAIAALAAVRFVVFPPDRLDNTISETTTGTKGPLGERTYVYLGPFHVKGSDPVHVRDVRLTDVPRGMRLIGVHAVENRFSGYDRGPLDPTLLHPFTDMVLIPGKERAWGVVVIMEGGEVGYWRTTGVDVDWRSGRHRGTTHFKYKVSLEVEPPAPTAPSPTAPGS